MTREIVRGRLTEDDILVLIAIAEKANEYIYDPESGALSDLFEKVEMLRDGVWAEVAC